MSCCSCFWEALGHFHLAIRLLINKGFELGSDFAGIKYFKDLQDHFNLFYLYLNFNMDIDSKEPHVGPHYRY